MVTVLEFAMELRKVARFRFLTVDRLSMKLWKGKPRYDFAMKAWVGSPDAWCGAISLEAAKVIAPVDLSKAILEVSDE